MPGKAVKQSLKPSPPKPVRRFAMVLPEGDRFSYTGRTVVAFSPLVFVPGPMGQFFGVLGGTVMLCLAFSLIEAQLILYR